MGIMAWWRARQERKRIHEDKPAWRRLLIRARQHREAEMRGETDDMEPPICWGDQD